MPANVAAAAPTTVLPAHIAQAFERQHVWPVEENEYANGERQSRARTTTPAVSWRLTPHVPEAIQTQLWNFLAARKFVEPFYFYDGTETSPPWTVDPTGSNSVGRYTVVAKGPLNIQRGLARALMNLTLEQRA